MNSCIEKVTPDDFADQPAFTIAIGKPKKNAQGKYTPQTYYTKEDHKLIACNDDLYKVITSHGIKLAEGATPEEVKAVKSQLGYFVPGGLISGGSDTEIKGSAYGKPENDIYTRRNGNIAPSGIASFDVDELSDLAYEKLTGGAAGLVGGGEGVLDSYHGLAYETISSKPGARRLRLALFLNEAVAVADKAIVYAKIEQMIMREIGAERGEIQRTNKKGDVVNVPGWMMPDGFTAFDGTAPRETQLMYNPPAGDDWPIWMFDGERIDVNALPELDEGAMVRAQSVPNTGQWQAPENVSELAGYLVENDLAEWHDDKTLNVVCAYEEEHSSGEPGQITNSTVLKLDAIESRQRFTCSHHGCHAAGHWQGADVQARFARKLGVPEGIISRTFGNESAIHEFEQLEPLKPAVVPFDDDDGISVDIRGYQEISEDITPDNLDVKAWLNVDLNNPPGLVGDIVRAIDSTAHRELKPAAVAAALQIVATAAGIGKRRGLHGGKLALITLTIAESASGKEPAQNFIKSLFSHMKMVKYLAGAPRSDKDLIINAMTSDAVTLYPIDEAHQFMKSIGDSKSSEFKQALGALMLETATTSCLVLSLYHINLSKRVSAILRETSAGTSY